MLVAVAVPLCTPFPLHPSSSAARLLSSLFQRGAAAAVAAMTPVATAAEEPVAVAMPHRPPPRPRHPLSFPPSRLLLMLLPSLFLPILI